MALKICVYAICKNESKFVDRWLASMSEADYIVVLDTGSTDGTYELLKNDSRVTRVEQKVFDPWRFDVARNESLTLVPEDADVLCAIDLDEWFEPGWAAEIRRWWIPNEHTRCAYKYAWSHDSEGNPERIFKTDKIHDQSWHWRYPVHETLDKENGDDYYNETLNLFDLVYLHHYPDSSKSRSTYLPLLELRVAENPDDVTSKIYLAHQYYYEKHFDKAINLLGELIENKEVQNDTIFLASCWMFLGDAYRAKKNPDDAISAYSAGISSDPTFRENYMNLAEVLNEEKRYQDAALIIHEGLDKSYRHYSWLERDESWTGQPWDGLSIAYYYLGLKDLSKYFVTKAREAEPANPRIQNNYNIIFDIH